jgi:nitrile hydratase beta subunit
LSDSLRTSVPAYDMEPVPTVFRTTWTWADLRKAAEAVNPLAYFQFRYYEKWLGGITAYFLDNGYITQAELDAAIQKYRGVPEAALPEHQCEGIDAQVIKYLREGDSSRRGHADNPSFATGDHVVVRNPPATDHTRLPGYLRGHTGRVERVFEGKYGYFCSTGADRLGAPVPVYLVRFEPQEIWGERTETHAGPLYAEIYESYLSPPS